MGYIFVRSGCVYLLNCIEKSAFTIIYIAKLSQGDAEAFHDHNEAFSTVTKVWKFRIHDWPFGRQDGPAEQSHKVSHRSPMWWKELICVGAVTCLIIETGRIQNLSPRYCNSTDICTCFQDKIPEIFIPRCVQRHVTGLDYLNRGKVGLGTPVMWKENLTNDGWEPWCRTCTPSDMQHLSIDAFVGQGE